MSNERAPHAATEYLEGLMAIRAAGVAPTPHEALQGTVSLFDIDDLLKLKEAAARTQHEAEQAQQAFEKALNSRALIMWPALEAEMKARRVERLSA